MLVKELANKSDVKKNTIDQYLSATNQSPSVEAGIKIAKVSGLSVEYLVTGKDDHGLSDFSRHIAQFSEQLDNKNKAFVLDFVKWLSARRD
jgi:transcriptional regulator with XRE-family HTH domain